MSSWFLWWHFSWYKRIYRRFLDILTHMHGFTAHMHNHDKQQFAVVFCYIIYQFWRGIDIWIDHILRKKICIKCNWQFKLTESGSILCFLKMTVKLAVFRKLLCWSIEWLVDNDRLASKQRRMLHHTNVGAACDKVMLLTLPDSHGAVICIAASKTKHRLVFPNKRVLIDDQKMIFGD